MTYEYMLETITQIQTIPEESEKEEKKLKYPVLTLEKALDIINYFKTHISDEGISLTEICNALNMKKSSDTSTKITFEKQIKDGNAKYYMKYQPFADFVKALDGEFELSTKDSPRFPRSIKFTSVSDPDIYFMVKN